MSNSQCPRSRHRRALRERRYPIVVRKGLRPSQHVPLLAIARTLQAMGRTLLALGAQILKLLGGGPNE